MKKDIEKEKKFTSNWFVFLQKEICKQFEKFEKNISKNNSNKFVKKTWNKENNIEGGGTYYVLKGGAVFDKVGVNQSTVTGQFKKEFRSKIYGAEKNGKYWASGISVVAHMKNPKMPAIHFNTRFIVTSKSWFGGGLDVTPSYKDNKEKVNFHKKLMNICKKK